MPLTQDATMNQIIALLDGLQGVNNKAELASVIGSPATATDDIAVQIQKLLNLRISMAQTLGSPTTESTDFNTQKIHLQSRKDSLAVTLNQKGVPVSNTDSLSWLINRVDQLPALGTTRKWAKGNGVMSGTNTVSVRNLSFRPSTILVYSDDIKENNSLKQTYMFKFYTSEFTVQEKFLNGVFGLTKGSETNSIYPSSFLNDKPISIFNNGFDAKLSADITITSFPYYYVAIE